VRGTDREHLKSGARNFGADGSFDWLLLLYLGSGEEQITQLEQVTSIN
jgi:hypothetical protein